MMNGLLLKPFWRFLLCGAFLISVWWCFIYIHVIRPLGVGEENINDHDAGEGAEKNMISLTRWLFGETPAPGGGAKNKNKNMNHEDGLPLMDETTFVTETLQNYHSSKLIVVQAPNC